MQTLSSASRTCIAALSAVECSATVLMPISRQARWTRSAISPRLAMRIFSNILFDDDQHFAVFHWRAVLDKDLRDLAAAGRLHRIEGLHRLDQQQRLSVTHGIAHFDEGRRARL